MLAVTYACAFVDRIIISAAGAPIIRDLGLSDLQFGLLGGLAFALFFSLFGLPVARLAEWRPRVPLIAVSIAVWSVMTALCGLARSYVGLLACRMGVGLGEAGVVPASHSLISDLFPPRARATALAVFSLGVPIGALAGGWAGGWLTQTYGWRPTMMIVGLPGLLLAALVWWTVDEPPREAADARSTDAPPPLRAVVAQLFADRASRHVLIGAVLATTAANGINVFAPMYFVRTFDLTLAQAGAIFGLLIGVSGIAGILAGGLAADVGGRRDLRWHTLVPAFGVACACPLYLLGYSRSSLPATIMWLGLGAMSLACYFAPSFAILQNLVGSRMRASASALLLLAMNVVGQGLGPVIIGWGSDRFATRAFGAPGDYAAACLGRPIQTTLPPACATASATGLRLAILTTVLLLVWSAWHYARAGRPSAQPAQA